MKHGGLLKGTVSRGGEGGTEGMKQPGSSARTNLLPNCHAVTEPTLTHQHDEVGHGLMHRAAVHAGVQVPVAAFHLRIHGHPAWLLTGARSYHATVK